MMIKKIVFLLIAMLAFPLSGMTQIFQPDKAERWSDSVFHSLTLEEQIGQLIFVRANYPFKPYDRKVEEYIKKYNIGGVTFFGGYPIAQALQTNRWNKIAKTPLFISIDAEWGLGMRLKNTLKYPLQMTLGAQNSDSLLYVMGVQIGEQCKRMGIHFNFAPVTDVNSNPENPIIGMRSFGENPDSVARKAWFYAAGMEDAGIIACAKHFPGHGDTYKDSHKTLPVVNASKREITSVALYPYKFLFAQHHSVSSVMIAHLSVPAFDKRKNYPASLSRPIVTKLLKKKMGFEGLAVTDGLDMKGVTMHFGKDKVGLMAFEAGNDILLIPEDVDATVTAIKKSVLKSKKMRRQLEKSCKKILKYKYLTGAWKKTPVDTTHLIEDLNKPHYHRLISELFNRSVTVVQNQNNILPLSVSDTTPVAVVVVGNEHSGTFEKTLVKTFNIRTYYLKHNASKNEYDRVLSELKKYPLAIITLVNTNISASRRFGIAKQDVAFAEKAARKTVTVLDIFASPYSLGFFSDPNAFDAVVVSYQDKPEMQRASAEVIAGQRPAQGKLPVSIAGYQAGTGIQTAQTRLRFGTPEEVGADTLTLKKIDSIAEAGIQMQAYPGCQILAAKEGVIFYYKTFGYHTYAKQIKESADDLYDLASLTKILATTPALIKLTGDGMIDLNGKLSDYLPFLKGTNKEHLGFKEVLSHQAGLKDWIPFYKETILPDGSLDPKVYRHGISENYPVRVAQNLYIRKDYNYRIYREIADSPLSDTIAYKYSDLGFYLLKKLIEERTSIPFDAYVYQNIYKPLGTGRLVFTPRNFFPLVKINPTENDTLFRRQLLTGDVHDQGAAMLGGVSGHAGLFGNAYDVAVVMQMFLNKGKYNGRQILKPEVFDRFNHRYFVADSNRRGLGFDKPLLKYRDHRTNCKSVSESSFGHSGFTGTYAWADPENGLVYVFLSNRVHPDMYNPVLMEEDIRTNIHQLFYDSLKKERYPAGKNTR